MLYQLWWDLDLHLHDWRRMQRGWCNRTQLHIYFWYFRYLYCILGRSSWRLTRWIWSHWVWILGRKCYYLLEPDMAGISDFHHCWQLSVPYHNICLQARHLRIDSKWSCSQSLEACGKAQRICFFKCTFCFRNGGWNGNGHGKGSYKWLGQKDERNAPQRA